MQFKNGLALFVKTNGRGSYNLASFHSPHSMTWAWILSFTLPRRGEGRWFYFSWTPQYQQRWCFQFAKFGLCWLRQRPMWYRDSYQRLRDKQDGLLPSDDQPLPHQIKPALTVIDGGNSVH